jgi:hypothetical protein
MDFLDLLTKAGFAHSEIVGKTGFKSSPKTEGVLLRAAKPEFSTTIQN